MRLGARKRMCWVGYRKCEVVDRNVGNARWWTGRGRALREVVVRLRS